MKDRSDELKKISDRINILNKAIKECDNKNVCYALIVILAIIIFIVVMISGGSGGSLVVLSIIILIMLARADASMTNRDCFCKEVNKLCSERDKILDEIQQEKYEEEQRKKDEKVRIEKEKEEEARRKEEEKLRIAREEEEEAIRKEEEARRKEEEKLRIAREKEEEARQKEEEKLRIAREKEEEARQKEEEKLRIAREKEEEKLRKAREKEERARQREEEKARLEQLALEELKRKDEFTCNELQEYHIILKSKISNLLNNIKKLNFSEMINSILSKIPNSSKFEFDSNIDDIIAKSSNAILLEFVNEQANIMNLYKKLCKPQESLINSSDLHRRISNDVSRFKNKFAKEIELAKIKLHDNFIYEYMNQCCINNAKLLDKIILKLNKIYKDVAKKEKAIKKELSEMSWLSFLPEFESVAVDEILSTECLPIGVSLDELNINNEIHLFDNSVSEIENEYQRISNQHLDNVNDIRNAFILKIQEVESKISEVKSNVLESQDRIDTLVINLFTENYEALIENYEKRLSVEPYFKFLMNCIKIEKFDKIEFDINYNDDSQILLIDCKLPNNSSVSKVKERRWLKTKNEYKDILMNDKDFSKYYDSCIKKIALYAVEQCFEYDTVRNVKTVIFNGWVENVNKSNGQYFTACILSFSMSRENYEDINFALIDVVECIKSLKGLVAGNLVNQMPVKPIMQVNKSDSRFIETKEVLEGFDEAQNLATMDWFDFEHLISELFAKYFSREGCEVKVTQSSRDGGVDAIAFDSDLIRGGKYVIQAKRYNNVVPVSAVRDLYGTMINEGAVKGILVTTSYYGKDSIEFAKDKPITLIDGSNLIYMLNEYGYNMRIQLHEK